MDYVTRGLGIVVLKPWNPPVLGLFPDPMRFPDKSSSCISVSRVGSLESGTQSSMFCANVQDLWLLQ